ncbi:MAG: RNA methyltransferase [Candidatus Uhrbacteria bacterium]|nr:RNA methyltransferase [Candidatus Uhrbacteria bacterium]
MRLVLILHNIRSALNVGSIFRTADAVGVEKIYLGGYTPTPDTEGNPSSPPSSGSSSKLSKTALGAEKAVPWEHVSQTWRILEQLKKEKYQIVALEQSKGSIDYRKFKPKFPLVLVVGNELTGLSSQLLKYCDAVVEIPMRGKKESLNVSVAVGIALYSLTWSRSD